MENLPSNLEKVYLRALTQQLEKELNEIVSMNLARDIQMSAIMAIFAESLLKMYVTIQELDSEEAERMFGFNKNYKIEELVRLEKKNVDIVFVKLIEKYGKMKGMDLTQKEDENDSDTERTDNDS